MAEENQFWLQVEDESWEVGWAQVEGLDTDLDVSPNLGRDESAFALTYPTRAASSRARLVRATGLDSKPIADWFNAFVSEPHPVTATVELRQSGTVVMRWTFMDVSPRSWSVSSVEENTTLVQEELELSYTHSQRFAP
jgi:hypothetical protein